MFATGKGPVLESGEHDSDISGFRQFGEYIVKVSNY
jgi:hypothetical protein